MFRIPFGDKRLHFLGLIALFLLSVVSKNFLPAFFFRLPETFFLPVAELINEGLYFLQDEFWLISVTDEDDIQEDITVVMIATKAFSNAIQLGIDLIRNILMGGDKGLGLPAIPWTALASTAFILGFALKGWRLSLLAGGSVIYLAVFGQWAESMRTLSIVFVAWPASLFIGLVLGVLAEKHKTVEWMLTPLLNVAQSLPHFSYLIPVVVFFGIGDKAGAIATIIFATPPMIRLTLLGLRKIPAEIIDAGKMAGCTGLQLLFKVKIPSARQDIMIGVNQVIMQCLAMAVIASFIGAAGLGYSLLVMLSTLKIGKALELGITIVLMAVVLDRLSLALAYKQPDYRAGLPFYIRYKYPLLVLGSFILCILFSRFFPFFYQIPETAVITTAPFWDRVVTWVVLNWSEALGHFRTFLLLDILIPMRDLYISLPFMSVLILAGGGGYILGGIKSLLTVSAFVLFIAFTGWWDKAIITAYMVSFSVITSVMIGLTLGIWASRKINRAKTVLLLCDTFQTFPSFVYLIPVIMLFQVNDVSVITAVIIYASIPATRYTIEGLRNISQSLQDAGTMSGVNKIQRLLLIELPLAFPHIMLGVNQTVLFSLFMVIIGAFIGTQDLGQDIMQALSESDMGKGLVLGLCVAFMGLAIDHLIMKWSSKRKKDLGL